MVCLPYVGGKQSKADLPVKEQSIADYKLIELNTMIFLSPSLLFSNAALLRKTGYRAMQSAIHCLPQD